MPPPQKQKQAADPGSVERFAADLTALAGPDWHDKRYGVAVSGGPDSMALLWLVASSSVQRGRLSAAHRTGVSARLTITGVRPAQPLLGPAWVDLY